MPSAKLQCPRCGRIWTIEQPTESVECVCHLYCSQGSDPKDCSVTAYEYTGDLKYPAGMDNSSLQDPLPVLGRTYYCSTHSRYISKFPVIMEVEWKEWLGRRRLSRSLMEVESNR